MYRIVKKLHFSYGHRLLGYEGRCAHPHGHNAEVELELQGEKLDEVGMLMDFGEISGLLATFIEPVFKMDVNPTAENIARLIFLKARELGLPVEAVRLWETPRACAEYRE
jgi:6-pyruvoyltetrahydropterin/6-carboxytetrahydropterin synthase